MNEFQRVWWEQTRADHEVLLLLRDGGERPSHQLHYLQMVTEKLGKAYLWRGGLPPDTSHVAFVPFLQALTGRPQVDRPRIAACFNTRRFDDLRSWIRATVPLAYAIERLAPGLAGDGPNPEYPWPRAAPAHAPVTHSFALWPQLVGTAWGRQLLNFIDLAVTRFPDYA